MIIIREQQQQEKKKQMQHARCSWFVVSYYIKSIFYWTVLKILQTQIWINCHVLSNWQLS